MQRAPWGYARVAASAGSGRVLRAADGAAAGSRRGCPARSSGAAPPRGRQPAPRPGLDRVERAARATVRVFSAAPCVRGPSWSVAARVRARGVPAPTDGPPRLRRRRLASATGSTARCLRGAGVLPRQRRGCNGRVGRRRAGRPRGRRRPPRPRRRPFCVARLMAC